MVGQNLRYEIGTVTYKSDEGETSPSEETTTVETEEGASNTGAIAGSVTSVLVVLSGAIILILVLFVVFKRKTLANETLLAKRFAHQEMVETKGGIFFMLTRSALNANVFLPVFPSSEAGEGSG